jgi:hypothetical protein
MMLSTASAAYIEGAYTGSGIFSDVEDIAVENYKILAIVG